MSKKYGCLSKDEEYLQIHSPQENAFQVYLCHSMKGQSLILCCLRVLSKYFHQCCKFIKLTYTDVLSFTVIFFVIHNQEDFISLWTSQTNLRLNHTYLCILKLFQITSLSYYS